MTQRILVASGNRKKLAELEKLCAGLPVKLLTPADLPDGLPGVVEDGETFLDNATKKALSAAAAAAEQLGGGTQDDGGEIWGMADDSGLLVDALDGAPGVHSARFAGVDGEGRDAANNALLLDKLGDLLPEQRGAAFWCIVAVARPGELLFAVEGSARGRILAAPRGAGGFGYDPLFYHEESGAAFAELSAEEKALVSHRGQAVARLHNVLESVLPAARR